MHENADLDTMSARRFQYIIDCCNKRSCTFPSFEKRITYE